MEVMAHPPDAAAGGGIGGGRRSSDSSSPEFEFWMVRNPSCPQPHMLSADELFVDGVILPLHLLHQPSSEPPDSRGEPAKEEQGQGTEAEADVVEPAAAAATTTTESLPCAASPTSATVSPSVAPAASTSKRWKDIFRAAAGGEKRAEERERRRERKNSAGGATELNINIWPFSRSRSAGNGGARPKGGGAAAVSGRRASSAPCSRSNSRGESSKPPSPAPPAGPAKKWAASPSRPWLAGGGGVHVGRISPVWRIKRGGKKGHDPASDVGAGGNSSGPAAGPNASGDAAHRKGGGVGVRVLNLNVNTCIGYGHQPSCVGDDKEGSDGGDREASAANNATGSHFNLKTFFSKKGY